MLTLLYISHPAVVANVLSIKAYLTVWCPIIIVEYQENVTVNFQLNVPEDSATEQCN